MIIRELLAGSTRFNDLRRHPQHHRQRPVRRRLTAIAGIIEHRQEQRRGCDTSSPQPARNCARWLNSSGYGDDAGCPLNTARRTSTPACSSGTSTENLHLDGVPKRTVIELHFPDAPPEYRAYWLIVTPEGAEVCLTHPGGDVDLHLSSDVRTLTNVWMGNTTWAAALRTRTLKLAGNSELRRALRWLKLNVFAPVKRITQRSETDISRQHRSPRARLPRP